MCEDKIMDNLHAKSVELKICFLRIFFALYPTICLCFVFLYKLDSRIYYDCIRGNMRYGLCFFIIHTALNLYYVYELKKMIGNIILRYYFLLVMSFLLFVVIWYIISLVFKLGTFLLNAQEHSILCGIVILFWLFSFYVSMFYFYLTTRNRFAWISGMLRTLASVCFFIAAGMLSNLFKEFHLGDRGDVQSFYFHSYYALPILFLTYAVFSLLSIAYWSIAFYNKQMFKYVYKWIIPVSCVLFSYLFFYLGCLVGTNRIANSMEDLSDKYYSEKSISSFEEMRNLFRNDLISRINFLVKQNNSTSSKNQYLTLQDLQTHQDLCNALHCLQPKEICDILKKHFSLLSQSRIYFGRDYLAFFLGDFSKNNIVLCDEKHTKEQVEELIAFLYANKNVLYDVSIDTFFISEEKVLFPTKYPENQDEESVFVDFGTLQKIYPIVPLSYILWKRKILNERQCPQSTLRKSHESYFLRLVEKLQTCYSPYEDNFLRIQENTDFELQ